MCRFVSEVCSNERFTTNANKDQIELTGQELGLFLDRSEAM
jgi:hypothetical protein